MEDKENEEKENIRVTVQLADDIFKVMKDKRMREIDPDDRHKIVLQKYKNFADQYPVVLRFLARDLRYNRTAFIRMMEKMIKDQKAKAEADSKIDPKKRQNRDPMEAMKAFIVHQADYAKFLYLEECKRTGRHYSIKKANAIWRVEYDNMSKALKKIKEDEDNARNEFEEEKKKHLDERRRELLDFIMEERGEFAEEFGDDNGDGDLAEEPTEEEKEINELEELESYTGDLKEMHNTFKADESKEEKDKMFPGIDNEDLEEYSYILIYCRRLFDLAVKHNKMTDSERETYEEQIIYCLDVIDDEFKRRRKIVHEQKKQRDEEWLEGLVPQTSGKSGKNKNNTKSTSGKGKNKKGKKRR